MRLRKRTKAASPAPDRPTLRQWLQAFFIEQCQKYRSLRSMALGLDMGQRQLKRWLHELGLPQIFGDKAREHYKPLGPDDLIGGQGI